MREFHGFGPGDGPRARGDVYLPGHVTVLLSRKNNLKENKPPHEVFESCLAARRTVDPDAVLRITIFFYKVDEDWPTWLLMLAALLSRNHVNCSLTVLFDETSVGRDTEFCLRDCLVRYSDLRWALVHVWLAPSWVDVEGPMYTPEESAAVSCEDLCLDFHFTQRFGTDIRQDPWHIAQDP